MRIARTAPPDITLAVTVNIAASVPAHDGGCQTAPPGSGGYPRAAANLKLTSVYVTHDQEEALAVSDKIIVMREAEIAQEGRPHELYEEARLRCNWAGAA